jgi:serine/threonine protein phosphatase PrpC
MSDSWEKARIPLRFAEGFQLQGETLVQEDYFDMNPERGIFLLADGFGGGAGREAAQIAVKSVKQFLEQEAGDLDATLPFELRPYYSLAGNVLFNAVSFANYKLMEFNRKRAFMDSGGASLLAGYLEGRLFSFAQVGVNRLHLKRGAQVKEVVSPKSLSRLVNPMEDEGEGDQIPLMSFGTAKSLEPEITEIEIRPGDQLFLLSSGVKKSLIDVVFTLNSPDRLSQIIDTATAKSNASILWLGF